MHRIVYLGSTTGLEYERGLLREWGKRDIELACAEPAGQGASRVTGTDGAVASPVVPREDALEDADGVVVEHGDLDAATIRSHPRLLVISILDERSASVDVTAATSAGCWVTDAVSHKPSAHPSTGSAGPSDAMRRHALQDVLAGVVGERPSGRINEL